MHRGSAVTPRPDSGSSDSPNTLLLYCPYDRRVTRHTRRRSDQAVVCMECGRKVEGSETSSAVDSDTVHAQRTTAIPSISETAPRLRHRQARRSGNSWMPLAIALVVLIIVALAIFNLIGNLTASNPTLAPAPTAVTSSPVPSAPAAPAQPTTLRIANTDGLGAFLRRTPNLDDQLRAWPDNTELTVIGPDTTANGLVWKHVQDPAGNQGWIPAQYTVPGE